MPKPTLDVLYEDNHLLVVNKPVGLATQGVAEGAPSAITRAKEYLKRKYKKPGNVFVGVVSRLVPQKGLDLLANIADAIVALPAQLAVLGSGDSDLERRFLLLATRNPGRIAVRIGFDEALAHLIEAGADAFLMPSRFEPCGMNQMYSQRYGTPPVVRATGGLVDSVVDCNRASIASGMATGFVFDEPDAAAFLAAIRRAVDLYRDRDAWPELQRNGMAKDFGWDRAAREYAEIYRTLAGR